MATGHENRLTEAVARSIAKFATAGLAWDRLSSQFQREFLEQARAAIETYRNYDERR